MANGKTRVQIQILFLFLLIGWLRPAAAQGTAFTYQGRLNDNGAPASGLYDLRFTIYDSTNLPGTIVAGPLTNAATGVSNGVFTATLDFGEGVFTGPARWLDIAVRPAGSGAFNPLNPRQRLTATPHAVFANTASNMSGLLPASQLSGAIPPANLSGTYNNVVNFNNGANGFSGSFYGSFYGSTFSGGNFIGHFLGDGSGLVGVNASNSATLGGLASSNFWQTAGNSGTTPGAHFVGTTDAKALELRVGGVRALRIEPDPRGFNVPNITGGYISNSISSVGGGGNVIAGGGFSGGPNLIASNSSGVFIGAGSANEVDKNSSDSVINGGVGNRIRSGASTIAGGYNNTIETNAGYDVIGGGYGNSISHIVATIGGGYDNTSSGYGSVVGGGQHNVINAGWAVIAGGYFNTNSAIVAFIGAGDFNRVEPNSDYSVIGGGYQNLIETNSTRSVIGGGDFNLISGNNNGSTIGGGYQNEVKGPISFIGGGAANVAGGFLSTIVGGQGHQALANNSTIVGGLFNTNYGVLGFIGGGIANFAWGLNSTIPGGDHNAAFGSTSFAAGHRAKAVDDGAFVWADSIDADFGSSASNQFLVRATGGVQFVTGGAGLTLDGQPILGASSVAPASGSTNYIQNQTAVPQGASFNINGTGTASALTASTVNATLLNASTVNAGSANVSGIAAANGLIVTNSIRVPGAGIGTTTPAFIHRATGATIEPGATHRTTITHPLCDNDPNAILLITHNFSPSGVLDTHASSVYYNGVLSKWQIYHDDFTALTTNSAWNVLIIKP